MSEQQTALAHDVGNPFGNMPNMGLVFPFTLGFGIKISAAGFALYYFEFEAGIFGCAGPVQYQGEDLSNEHKPATGVGSGDSNEDAAAAAAAAALGFFGGGGEKDKDAPTFGEQLTVPGLDMFYCPAEDPYGKDPTVIKVAFVIDMNGGGTSPKPKVALLLILREFYVARMIFMFMKKPPGKGLLAMRPILDLFSAKKLDVSINMDAFPITLYSGTVIKPGILVDIEYLKMFGLMLFRKAYVHFVPQPFLLEIHLFIEPINLGGLIKVEGIRGEAKYEAARRQAEAKRLAEIEAKNVEEEAELAVKNYEAAKAKGLDATSSESSSYRTVCGGDACYSCARTVEGAGEISLACTSPNSVIANVTSAAWGEAAAQPDWEFTTESELCNSTAVPVGRMVRMDTRDTIEKLEMRCLNRKSCMLSAEKRDLGTPRDFTSDMGALALSVIVQCRSLSDKEVAAAEKREEAMTAMCDAGCLSCTKEIRDERENLIVGRDRDVHSPHTHHILIVYWYTKICQTLKKPPSTHHLFFLASCHQKMSERINHLLPSEAPLLYQSSEYKKEISLDDAPRRGLRRKPHHHRGGGRRVRRGRRRPRLAPRREPDDVRVSDETRPGCAGVSRGEPGHRAATDEPLRRTSALRLAVGRPRRGGATHHRRRWRSGGGSVSRTVQAARGDCGVPPQSASQGCTRAAKL